MKLVIRNMIIAVVIFSAVFAGSIGFIQGMNTNYPTTIPLTYSVDGETVHNLSSFNKLGELEQLSETLHGEIMDESDISILDTVGFVLNNLKGALVQMGTAIKTAITVAMSAQEVFGIPAFFITTVVIIITITLALGILSFIFKKDI